jgi:16S rRNA (guanine(1405)-N(7))-methyltransferase
MSQTAAGDATLTDALAAQILSSAKYRGLDPALVRRFTAEAAGRFADRGRAAKYARRKLHQAYGAFLAGSPAQAVTGVTEAVQSGRLPLREAALAAMRSHVSAAERAQWLDPFGEQIGQWSGSPRSVADLACGLGPLAIPWLPLAADASYWACEIDARLVAALAGLGAVMPAAITAVTRDLVSSPPELRADLALLLKTVPTLEQQRPGASARLLAGLDCAHVVMSLPRTSLGGRQYADDADALARQVTGGTGYAVRGTAAFGNEVLYLLEPEPYSPR